LVLLDLGANVDCRADHLAGFAAMGSAFARSVLGLSHPRVGLLSNGGEHGKGNSVVKEADLLIDGTGLDYVGPIEPPAAFRGGCDVLVCDGFVGNVLLKTAEATAELMGGFLREELEREPSGKLGAWLATDALGRMKARLDWAAHGGGQLLGVEGVVVVGHGRSDARAVALAIGNVYHSAQEELPRRVSLGLANMHVARS
jgi:glycerol-3-phosphate acyltransferase PlsX